MRDRGHRAERVAELIREELGELLQCEVKDPRVGFATVIAVHVSADMRTARVAVSILGDESQKKQSMEGLASARNYLRRELAQRLCLRHVPAMVFELDRTEESAQRIEELLRQSRNKP